LIDNEMGTLARTSSWRWERSREPAVEFADKVLAQPPLGRIRLRGKMTAALHFDLLLLFCAFAFVGAVLVGVF
jgi:hypothetical protein